MFEPSSKDWAGKTGDSGASPLRVLLAEDTPINAEMMRAMASHLKIDMDVAANGLETIAMIEAARDAGNPYSLLLLDVMMPILDGVETAKRLRQSGYNETELPIVAVTAATSLDEVRSYRAAGMQAFLEKPVALDDLRAALKAWGHSTRSHKQRVSKASLEALQQQFEERNLQTLDRIDAALEQERFDEEIVMEIRNLLHQIAGTATTFGNPGLGDDARTHENALMAAFFANDDVRSALEDAGKSLRERI